MKKFSAITASAGILMLLAGLILSLSAAGAVHEEDSLYEWRNGVGSVWTAFGAALLLSGVISFVFRKAIEENCSIRASRRAFIMSALSGMSLSFALIAVSNATGNTMGFHPDAYEISTIPVIFCGLGCVGLGCLYIGELRVCRKFKRLFFDIPLFVLFLPAFMLGWAQLFNLVAEIMGLISGSM